MMRLNSFKLLLLTILAILFIQSIGQSSVVSPFESREELTTFFRKLSLNHGTIDVRLLVTETRVVAQVEPLYSPYVIDIRELTDLITSSSGLTVDNLVILNQRVIIENQVITTPITLRNCTASDIINNDLNTSITVEDSNNFVIEDNQIHSITNTTLTWAISITNCRYTEIRNNTIYGIESNESTAIGIRIIDSYFPTVDNNDLSDISSTSTSVVGERDVFGIYIDASDDLQCHHNNITTLASNAKAYGIYAEYSSNTFLNDSRLTDISSKSSQGIFVKQCQGSIIHNSNINNLVSTSMETCGISAMHSPDPSIINNRITELTTSELTKGICLSNCSNAIARNNTIINLTTTAYFSLYGILIEDSVTPVVKWNVITNLTAELSDVYGIALKNCSDAQITSNSLIYFSADQNIYGIFVQSCDETVIVDNVLQNTACISYGLFVQLSLNSEIASNIISNYTYWVYADEQSINLSYSGNIVNGRAVSLLSFLRPFDLDVLEGTIESLTWIANDNKATNYSIYLDNKLLVNGTWIDSEPISIAVNGSELPLGTYRYELILTDSHGFNISDDVSVRVVELNAPTIIAVPKDIRILEGALGIVLSWTATDSHPDNYIVLQNGNEVAYGSWDSSVPINISIGGLLLGDYNYTVIAQDTSENSVSDTCWVYVLSETTLRLDTEMNSKWEYIFGSRGNVLDWTVQSLEGGSYSIFQDNESITAGAFEPGVPILYPIDFLNVDTYNFTINVETVGKRTSGSVIVEVVEDPSSGEENNSTAISPSYPNPPYLETPAGEDPFWYYVVGTLMCIGVLIGGITWYAKQRAVPIKVRNSQRALGEARKTQDRSREGKELDKIGKSYTANGNYSAAIKHFEQALVVFKQVGDKHAEQQTLGNLGDAYMKMGLKEGDE